MAVFFLQRYLLLLPLVAAVLGCSRPTASAPTEPKPFRIVCTTGIVADLVRAIVGDAAEVTSLIGTAVDPHSFTPRRSEFQRLLEADMVFANGLHLEGRMTESLGDLGRAGKVVVYLADGIPKNELRVVVKDQSRDPHVWMDPVLWKHCANFVAAHLCTALPAQAAEFRQRLSQYVQQLDDLDAYIVSVLSDVPVDRRIVITSHDAFSYFAARYRVQVKSVQGVSTESEAAVKDVEDIVALVVNKGLSAVFIESSVSPKTLVAVQEGAKARGRTIKLAGPLYSDAMGPASTYEGTYLGMMDANATWIAAALGGKPPLRGWQSKLDAIERLNP